MTINITPEALAPVVSAAILQHLSTEERDGLITQALQYLVTPPKPAPGSYGRDVPETPLQQALRIGVANAARQVIDEVIADSGLVKQIRDVLQPQVAGMLADHGGMREAVVTGIANALAAQFSKDW